MFYAALHSDPSGAPPGCCWAHQIQTPLTWIRSFLDTVNGELERRFTLDAYLRRGAQLTVTTDASPYGLGAVLEQNGQIMSFFASAILPTDRQVLSLNDEPTSVDQQVLEALALLVALREWASFWRNQRVTLSVRTDNIATLTMVCKMQPHSDRMGIISRELALDIAQSSVSPDDATHIPGIANTAADALSRSLQPGKQHPLPPYLSADLKWEPSPRPATWWKALSPTKQKVW